MASHDKLLNDLVTKLKTAHGKTLRSVILYGSAAGEDHHGAYSDLNVFCVLDEVSVKALESAEPVFQWWRDQHQPSPLLMSAEETRTSTDCFPIEFMDMRERRKLLHGDDVIAGLEIAEVFYRAQVEHELRAKLLRLRQKAAGVVSDKDLLTRLMTESVGTFCVLARHALRLTGQDAPWTKREIVATCERALGTEMRSFHTLLDVREQKMRPRALDAVALLESYLKEITALIHAVDALAR